MPVTENTEYEAAFEDPDDFGSARTFRRCVFQNFTFATTRDAVFDECTFRTVTFGGDGLRDSQATGCTFHETRFLPAAGISDVTFRKCVFTKLTGAWRARRCSWTECTFANVRFEPRAAVLLQCRLRDCQVADTTALASQWTDCALRAVTFERCALERAVWRRCAARGVRFDACALGSVAFGGNTWDACAWKDCGAAHAGFVGDRLSQCRVVAMKAPSARFSACEMVAVRDEGSDYSFSRWEATDLVDCPWIRVNLTEARCNKVTWTNCTHEAVRDVNALYSNVAHVKKPTVEGRVHFCGGGGGGGRRRAAQHHHDAVLEALVAARDRNDGVPPPPRRRPGSGLRGREADAVVVGVRLQCGARRARHRVARDHRRAHVLPVGDALHDRGRQRRRRRVPPAHRAARALAVRK
jgi:uncharacterized protein YjbI with pentapeptide repeats